MVAYAIRSIVYRPNIFWYREEITTSGRGELEIPEVWTVFNSPAYSYGDHEQNFTVDFATTKT